MVFAFTVRLPRDVKGIVLGIIGMLLIQQVGAAVYEGTPDNYRSLLQGLRAGDVLVLRSGTYKAGLPVHRMNGLAGAPIVITGAERGSRPVFEARRGHNTVSIIDSRHIVIRNLELDGRGLPVDAVKAEGHSHWAHHIHLEDLLIHGHGNNQQTVGISTKCPAWKWVIRGNVITGAGTGIYLGNSNGKDPFIAGLIENNLILDSIGYNLQIKHQLNQPVLPGLPPGGKNTVIRHNVFSKAKGGSIEVMARPNVLVGHWPPAGPGANDQYLVYGNLFHDNPNEALFQGEGNIALYQNLFVNPHGDTIHVQPHNDVPKRIDIFNNTIVAKGEGITVRRREGDHRFSQQVVANAVFGARPLTGGIQRGNLVGDLDAAGAFLTAPYGLPGQLDLYPKTDWLEGKGAPTDLSEFSHYPDWNRDFNGVLRSGRFPGAYGGEGDNPGWRLDLRGKP